MPFVCFVVEKLFHHKEHKGHKDLEAKSLHFRTLYSPKPSWSLRGEAQAAEYAIVAVREKGLAIYTVPDPSDYLTVMRYHAAQ